MTDFRSQPTYLGDPLSMVTRGAASDRPAAGTPGRVYFDTDNRVLQRDNGAGWDDIEGASGDFANPMSAKGDLIVGGDGATGLVSTSLAGATFTDGGNNNGGLNPLSAAFDGNDTTAAGYNSGGPRWIRVDLGSTKTIDFYRVLQNGSGTQKVSDATIQYSTDDVSWTTLVSLGSFTDTGIVTASGTSARYWRLYSAGGASAVWLIHAFELYGSVSPGSPERLPIGTTDQVLTVVAGAPAWAAASGSSGIPASTVDAKGDLIAGTADNTVARLAAGSDDTILMADSAQTTGLKWVGSQTPSTQAFSDAAAQGTADTFSRGDHKHAMPADPVTAHAAASDPHTGYVLESLLDAKGDLIVASADNTPARVAVGSNDQVLTADSTQATGVKWATGTAGAPTDAHYVTTQAESGLSAEVLLSAVVGYGVTASRPAAGTAGRLYYSTDDGILYRDNGATWDSVEGSGTGGGAPSTADYVTETAQSGLSAESVLGTIVITTTAYGSRQAAAKAGRLFLPNDGRALYRDSGSAWLSWGPLYPYTDPPAVADWTWVNQSTAAATDSQAGIYMTVPANGSTNLRILVRTAPSTPYTITALFFAYIHGIAQNSVGLVHRQSSDGKLTYFNFFGSTQVPHISVGNYTNATTFSAAPADVTLNAVGQPIMLRMSDDGTNRTYSWSHDGVNWIQIYQVARATFATPDQVGWAVDASNASNAPAATLASWLVA